LGLIAARDFPFMGLDPHSDENRATSNGPDQKDETIMAELVCVAFEDANTADRLLNELQIMQKEHLVELADACVVIRNAAGGLHLKQAMNLVAGGSIGGGAMGAFWGSLIGLLFLNPLAGMVVGAGVGAATGGSPVRCPTTASTMNSSNVSAAP